MTSINMRWKLANPVHPAKGLRWRVLGRDRPKLVHPGGARSRRTELPEAGKSLNKAREPCAMGKSEISPESACTNASYSPGQARVSRTVRS